MGRRGSQREGRKEVEGEGAAARKEGQEGGQREREQTGARRG